MGAKKGKALKNSKKLGSGKTTRPATMLGRTITANAIRNVRS